MVSPHPIRLVRSGLLAATVPLLLALIGCPDDDPDIEFECDTHDECLDDEACLDDLCIDEPVAGDTCPADSDGEKYDTLTCEDGHWVDEADRPDAPRIDSVTAEPPTSDPGETIELAVEVTAEDEEALTYQWSAPDGWNLVDDDAPQVELVAHDDYGETATIDIVVTDSHDQSDSDELITSTHDVDGPEIQNASVEPDPVVPDGVQTLEVDAEYPQELEVDYEWKLPDGWSFEGGQNSATIDVRAPATYESSGDIELLVRDDPGNEATISMGTSTLDQPDFEVTTDPAQLFVDPEDSDVVEAIVDHEYRGDFDVEIVDYEWAIVDDDWGLDVDDDEKWRATVTGHPDWNEETELSVEVVDEFDAVADTAIDVVTGEDKSPSITSAIALEDPPFETDHTFNVQVTAEGDDLTYEWTNDGDWQITNDDQPTANVTIPESPADDEVSITVTVSNDYGEVSGFIDVYTHDYAPDDFGFDDVSDGDLDEEIRSNTVELTGFDIPVDAHIETCEADFCELRTSDDSSLNPWSNWDETVSDVEEGDEVQLRLWSSDELGTTNTASVTVGDTTSQVWEVTTKTWDDEITLTPCGAEGHDGPDGGDCSGTYEDTDFLDGNIEVVEGRQFWTVPVDGTYRIDARGAQGGGSDGGAGAQVAADFALEAGETLEILVGQRGTSYEYLTTDYSVSGGGASFVVTGDIDDDSPVEPLAIAGGGGGSMATQSDDRHGSEGSEGMDGNSVSTGGEGGEDGNGGHGGDHDEAEGGGGGGLLTDGVENDDYAGLGFHNGGFGGSGQSDGGFGGGASAFGYLDNEGDGHRYACAGGGGYSGGGFDITTDPNTCQAGGGGSKLNEALGNNLSTETGVNTGDGEVIIELVETSD